MKDILASLTVVIFVTIVSLLIFEEITSVIDMWILFGVFFIVFKLTRYIG